MLHFSIEPEKYVDGVAVFPLGKNNIDPETVASFGDEWKRFDAFSEEEIQGAGDEYFDLISKAELSTFQRTLDMGCGSGRWTRYIAPHVAQVAALDPSLACHVARRNTKDLNNVQVVQASVENIPFPDAYFDFAICLGVLHHIPDTQEALAALCKKIQPKGKLLLYLYYDLSETGLLFRTLHSISEMFRKVIHRMPKFIKNLLCDFIAALIYLPLIVLSKVIGSISKSAAKKMPLSYYRNKSWRIIRNDARDRFGTPLEQRFTKEQITAMLQKSGMKKVVFSPNAPYWHCIAEKG